MTKISTHSFPKLVRLNLLGTTDYLQTNYVTQGNCLWDIMHNATIFDTSGAGVWVYHTLKSCIELLMSHHFATPEATNAKPQDSLQVF